MKKGNRFYKKWVLFLILAVSLLASCGGGGGTTSGTGPSVNGTISGTAIKGPVSDATVTAFAIDTDGTKGGAIGSAKTDGAGNFSIPMGDYAGSVMLQMTGGSYMDEATGIMMNMAAGDVMTAMVSSMSAGASLSGIQITPLTSMAQSMAQNMVGGMSQANISAANTAMGNYFGVSDILTTHPMDPTVNGSGSPASKDMRNYGMAIAAMSQYAKNIGMPVSSGMVTSMMNDASDGIMNGKMMGGTQIMMGGGMMGGTMMQSNAGTTGLANAMMNFIQSPMNKSGLTLQDMQALMNKLDSTNGAIL